MLQPLPKLGMRFKSPLNWLVVFCFLILIFIPLFLHLSGLATDPSFIDNRPPTKMPLYKSSTMKDYKSHWKNYIRDNFGLRAEFVKFNTFIHHLAGVSNIPSLIFGKEGWVFLKTDMDVFNQYRGVNRFTNEELDSWIDTMESYQTWLIKKNIRFYILIAPNQETIYSEYMPFYATKVNKETRLDQVMRRVKERNSSLIVIDLRERLKSSKSFSNDYYLYHKYENHWNSLGAFIGYGGLVEAISKDFHGIDPIGSDDIVLNNFVREWNVPPVLENTPILKLKKPTRILSIESLSGVDLNGRVEKVVTSNNRAPSLFFYGDSFGDAGLTPLLKETFSTTITSETNWMPFPASLIDETRPNIVVYELVERYLARKIVRSPLIDENQSKNSISSK
jgi:alginate O-acetyltransferase complex protein AlgJ